MSEDKKVVDFKKPPTTDTADMSDLWLDPGFGDALTETHLSSIPVGKPKDFFRVCEDKAFRRQSEIYTHKVEGMVDEQNFVIAKPMRGKIEEARKCTLVVCIYRDGSLRIWPLKSPRDGEKDDEAWKSARSAISYQQVDQADLGAPCVSAPGRPERLCPGAGFPLRSAR
jgi:hypothetical protein